MASSTAPSTSLYVGDLSKSTTESTLYETFSAAGSIASVRVCRDTTTRQSLGYAYVNFHRPEDAERAFDTLNFKLIDGKPCRIMWTQRDPTLRKNGMGNVFIKNLAKSIDQKQLYDTFSIFGNILSCKVAKAADGTPLGYGFVHYDSEASANAAIAGVDGKLIEGSQVSASAFRSKEERESANKFTNVYVKNIPDDWTDPQLRELFAQYGQITSSLLLKGFGFVNFQEHDQATQAIQGLQGHTIGEKKLFVGRAKTKDERNKELHERRLERERSGANLYIKNLSDTITDESLKAEFTKFGKITSAKVMTDGHGNSRGFGFISFSTRQEATHAVAEMNGRMVSGKPLYVGFAQKKDQRKQQLESQFNARGRFPPMIPPQYYPQQMYYPPGYPQGYMYAAPPQGQRGGPQQFPAGRGYPPQYRQQGPPRGAMRAAPKPQQPQLPQDKQALGEQLYPLVKAREPEQAGKITGMLLEMEVQELHELLSNDQSLDAKIREALAVLQEADQ